MGSSTLSKTDCLNYGNSQMADNFLISGSEKIAGRKNFKLVGCAEKFEELCTILTRMESNSAIVSGLLGQFGLENQFGAF